MSEEKAQETQEETVAAKKGKKIPFWKKVLFSEIMLSKNKTHKIAYIAVFTALNVVVNAVTSIALGAVQFSFAIFISALTGIVIGPLFGFGACFIGDTLGYIIGNGGGNGWTPWIGLATAMIAFLAGLIMRGVSLKIKGGWIVKLLLVCIATFVVSTIAINTTALYLLWYKKSFDSYWTFLLVRLFAQGQIWNSLVNYALLFITVPALNSIKLLKLHLY
ncbi:MAG: ECF transporter S component [Clostridia bacterium]|nr:ECF transporter S component [Clostridia bacterium]